jgi:hypothetical protein
MKKLTEEWLNVAEKDEILITALARFHRDPEHYEGRII